MTTTLSRSPDDRVLFRLSDDPLLSHLPDDRLLSRLDELAARERRITLCIVDHLAEVERRELYLAHGYGSMFSYCTGRLGYSASAASRRIRTARCVRRFPKVRESLELNRVNLSTVSMVAGILAESNHARLLARIEGRSQDEVKAIVAEYKPRGSVRDSVTPVCVRAARPRSGHGETNRTLGCEYDRSGRDPSVDPAAGSTSDPALSVEATAPMATAEALDRIAAKSCGRTAETKTPGHGDAPVSSATTAENSAERRIDRDEPLNKQFVVRFAAGPELVQQIEAARLLLSFKLPANAPLSQVLGAVLGEFIERNDPSRRAARRVKRAKCGPRSRNKKQNDRGESGTRRKSSEANTTPAHADNPRAIPVAVRDTALAASGNRCEYVSSSGRRCDATMHLQIDHIVPVALGGTAARANLRVLCARHNRLEAERLLGETGRAGGFHVGERGAPRFRVGERGAPRRSQSRLE